MAITKTLVTLAFPLLIGWFVTTLGIVLFSSFFLSWAAGGFFFPAPLHFLFHLWIKAKSDKKYNIKGIVIYLLSLHLTILVAVMIYEGQILHTLKNSWSWSLLWGAALIQFLAIDFWVNTICLEINE